MAKTKKIVANTGKTLIAKKAKVKTQKSVVTVYEPKTKMRTKLAKPEGMKAPIKKSTYSLQELEHFRTIIIEKKKEILEELETLRDTMMDSTTGEYASENSMYSTHMEQGTDSMEREKTFLFASREGKFLNYLEDALVRIDKGEYGRCTICSKLIEKERLEAVPHAQQCLQCKLRSGK
jgi:DnaK suppressor protein